MIRNTSLSNQFGAFWDPDGRAICIALSRGTTEGEIIGSIIFELHNALVNSKFKELEDLVIRRKINRSTYVRSMEYLEYVNSINASKLADKGIQNGFLPADSRLMTYSNFEEHFSEQKRSGHSACFESHYDYLVTCLKH